MVGCLPRGSFRPGASIRRGARRGRVASSLARVRGG